MPVDYSVSHRSRRRPSSAVQENVLVKHEEKDPDFEAMGELQYPDSDSELAVESAKSRRRASNNPPRPPNAFICFRSAYCAKNKRLPGGGTRNHRQVSRDAAAMWNVADDVTRAHFIAVAAQKKKEHALKYPSYTYTPAPRAGGSVSVSGTAPNKSKKRKASAGDSDDDYSEHASRTRASKRKRSDVVATPARLCSTPPATVSSVLSARPTPELSLDGSTGSPELPPRTPEEDDIVEEFVPTADIPELNLEPHVYYSSFDDSKAAISPSGYDSNTPAHFLSYQEPTPQFFKYEVPIDTQTNAMWFTPEPFLDAFNGELDERQSVFALPPINTAMNFTNPFTDSLIESQSFYGPSVFQL